MCGSRKISAFLIKSPSIPQNLRSIKDNNDLINEIILSAKIKETKKITKHYKDLPEEIRKVQKIHQNLKLEQWGLGQTKAVHQYDPNQFDKELGAILAQSIIEKGLSF